MLKVGGKYGLIEKSAHCVWLPASRGKQKEVKGGSKGLGNPVQALASTASSSKSSKCSGLQWAKCCSQPCVGTEPSKGSAFCNATGVPCAAYSVSFPFTQLLSCSSCIFIKLSSNVTILQGFFKCGTLGCLSLCNLAVGQNKKV